MKKHGRQYTKMQMITNILGSIIFFAGIAVILAGIISSLMNGRY
jgi:hypothetical protein